MTMDELKNFVYVSIISADNDEFGLTEDDKQEIIRRRKMGMSWDSVFEPIPDVNKRNKIIELFEESEVD